MSQERTEQATPHRLREARKKGQVPVSAELNGAAGFVAAVAWLLLQAGDVARQLHTLFLVVLGHVQTAGRPEAPATAEVMLEIGIVLARLCVPPLVVAAAASLLVGVAQTRGLVTFELLKPQLARVDPVQGVTKVFSMRNLLTLLKLLAGLGVIGVVVAVMYRDMLPEMIRAGYVPASRTVVMSWYFVSRLVIAGALVAVLMAAADFFIQRFSFARQMRMSKQEVQDEHKNTEGDPMVKGRRRQFFEELLDGTTQEKIAEAQVLVANPTHVAIVIRYQPGKVDLPMVTAKGLDERALAMRLHAEKLGVPVYENRRLARDLYRDCRPKEFITHQYFEAMAEVFKWLDKLKNAKEMARKTAAAKETNR